MHSDKDGSLIICLVCSECGGPIRTTVATATVKVYPCETCYGKLEDALADSVPEEE